MDYDFADDLRGPDPDRFNWYPFAIAAAAIICLIIGWWVA